MHRLYVAAGSLGLPDLGISTLDDVLTDVRRITDVCPLPLLVDVDTGFGPSAFNVARTVRSLIRSERFPRCLFHASNRACVQIPLPRPVGVTSNIEIGATIKSP